MKILNLYAGIGGNRKLWEDVEVTAIEIDEKIADIYYDFFPEDTVIVADAHQYLLDHFKEFDFIWSSPPCPTHSVCNNFLHAQGIIRYPDMQLWQEIILLMKFHKGQYCIENVKTYYEPLIEPQERDRHYFWANFFIKELKISRDFNIANASGTTRMSGEEELRSFVDLHNIDLAEYEGIDKRKLLRNCVIPELGKHILDCARSKSLF